jgi:hypothetical protein
MIVSQVLDSGKCKVNYGYKLRFTKDWIFVFLRIGLFSKGNGTWFITIGIIIIPSAGVSVFQRA